MQPQNVQAFDGKILVTIKAAKNFKLPSESFYVPKQSAVNYLRAYIARQAKLNSQDSFFLFAYGCILNNHDKMGDLYHKFKPKINCQYGIEIQYAQMSSF